MVQKKYSDATRDKQIGNALRSLFSFLLLSDANNECH